MLIIGCGNELRGDDAAGLLVARHLRSLGLNACEHTGDGLSLIELWKPASEVTLVDAVSAQGKPGRVRVWDGKAAPLLPEWLRSSSHFLGIAEAIEMARFFGTLPPHLWICGIEGKQFELGTCPCPEVVQAVQQVIGIILNEEFPADIRNAES